METAERIGMEKKLKVGGYASFTRRDAKEFEAGSHGHFFTSLERLQLVQKLVTERKVDGGCGIDLEVEQRNGVLSNVLPLHDGTARRQLFRTWCTAPMALVPRQPLDEVRDYFGEKIALYFAFIESLTVALLVPSVVGFVVLFASVAYGSSDNPLSPLYSLVVLVWIT
eukprot:302166-Prymnesium_polylepis.1